MTRFYGFPKANRGVVPEEAKRFRVILIWGIPLVPGVKTTGEMHVLGSSSFWELNGNKTDIVAYIVTDFPL